MPIKWNVQLRPYGLRFAVGLLFLLVGYALGNQFPLRPVSKASQLLYISNGFTHIYDLKTGSDTPVGNLAGDMNKSAISPDGKWVVSWSNSKQAFWTLGLLSTTSWTRTELGEFQIAFPTLSWAANSQQIAFAAEPEGSVGRGFDNSELFIMDVQTGALEQLTDNHYRDDSPAFSPDGRRLAYTSAADGYNRLYIMDIATRESHLLTDQAFGYVPSWSPDGSQIAFASNHEDRRPQVYVIDADGTRLRRVTFNTASSNIPFWIP